MMINSKVKRAKQQGIQKKVDRANSNQFFNLLTSEGLLEHVEELLPKHRERLYPPTETLSMFLAQALDADGSCQKVVNEMANASS